MARPGVFVRYVQLYGNAWYSFVHTNFVPYISSRFTMAPKNERFELRLDEDTLTRLDEWRSKQPSLPSRSEAVRRLVDVGLEADAPKRSVHFTDGEKALIGMFADLFEHLKIKETSNSDPAALMKAIYGGHYWGPKWEMVGLFNEHTDRYENVLFVGEVLEMWWQIELGYSKLSVKDKKRLEAEADPFGKHVRFPGFDGNNETEHMSIARYFVRELGRWADFKAHDMNSHSPMIPVYKRMLSEFTPVRKSLGNRVLAVDDLIVILSAMKATR